MSLSVLRKCNTVLSWFVLCKRRVRLRERLDVSQGVILAFIMKWWCQTCFTCHRGSTSHTESLLLSFSAACCAVLFLQCAVLFSWHNSDKIATTTKNQLTIFSIWVSVSVQKALRFSRSQVNCETFFYFCVFVCVSACFCVSAFFWLFAKKCFVAIYISLVIFIHKKRGKLLGYALKMSLYIFLI